MKRNKAIDKKINKKAVGKCVICGEKDYSVLDNHRIKPGCEGGKYTKNNVCVLCSNCHRKVHSGDIVIHRYYNSTTGRVLHVEIGGEEFYL